MPGGSNGARGHRKPNLLYKSKFIYSAVLTEHLLCAGIAQGTEVTAGKGDGKVPALLDLSLEGANNKQKSIR